MSEPTSSPRPYTFELSGGALCLDFANTWGDRERPSQDHLHAYGDVVAFARQSGILDDGQAAELVRRAEEESGAAAAAKAAAIALTEARALREAIYGIFSALAAGTAPPPEALDHLNAVLPDALVGLRIEPRGPRGEGFSWTGRAPTDSLVAPLRPIIRSAAELLTSDRLDRVRECAGATCTWLFLDQSRNRSRRWCSMETCGNRAKVRRHYRKQRAADD